jgi:uncharacterized repeat protein (TIGR01451 family)
MMRIKSYYLPLVFAAALLWVVFASASSLSFEEADLTSYGEVYEVNRDVENNLYLSDSNADEVWKVDSSGAYTVFVVSPVQPVDAKPDSNGHIWWTDYATAFGHIQVPTNTLTYWLTPEFTQLGGLEFDGDGLVWMTEWFGLSSHLFSFELKNTELCTYTISSGSSYSYYILEDNGDLWLGNWGMKRIYRVRPSSMQAAWWDLSDVSLPNDLALDLEGHLWWTDQGLNALARLDPETNQVVTYTLPSGNFPQMVEIQDNRIWYTESGDGTFGSLDPQAAQGGARTLTTSTSSLSKSCAVLGPGTTMSVSTRTGTLEWSAGSAPLLVGENGWEVYQLPASSSPYGIASASGYMWLSDRGRQKLVRIAPPFASITIEKNTNGLDADNPPGPSLEVGESVTWSYAVTNTGNVSLTNVTVLDDVIGEINCPKTSLAAGEGMLCTSIGTAVGGQYANLGTVNATSTSGSEVSDSDPSHYFGLGPAIKIEKHTNGIDADTPPGPSIVEGEAVTWTYIITNTGNVTLTGITILDDVIGEITCPKTSLAVGEDMVCTTDGTAILGQYANLGTVSGSPPTGPDVSDSDPSHYFGVEMERFIYLPIVIKLNQ